MYTFRELEIIPNLQQVINTLAKRSNDPKNLVPIKNHQSSLQDRAVNNVYVSKRCLF
jgi:hypothetical protein